MRWIQLSALCILAAVTLSCSSSNPRVENCKLACEGKGRHTSDMIDHCKRMCEKYK